MTLIYRLSRSEIADMIPYKLVAETAESVIWKTGSRMNLFDERFTEKEQEICNRLIRHAKYWSFQKGLPDEIELESEVFSLWLRLGTFCAEICRSRR